MISIKELQEFDLADWLDDTGECIERDGWWRGSLYGPDSQVCLVGGLLRSHNLTERALTGDPDPRVASVLTFLADQIPEDSPAKFRIVSHCTQVATWNDECAKDMQEVLDFLAKAAKVARAGYDPDA